MTWTPVSPSAPSWASVPSAVDSLSLVFDVDAADASAVSVALSNALQAGALTGTISVTFTFDEWAAVAQGAGTWVAA